LGRFARFRARTKVLPFERLIGYLVVISGVVGLAGRVGFGVTPDPLDVLFPSWVVVALHACYVVSGSLIVAGIGLANGRVEAMGLVVLGVSVVVRFAVAALVVGFTPDVVVLLALYVLILQSARDRVRALTRGTTVMMLENGGER